MKINGAGDFNKDVRVVVSVVQAAMEKMAKTVPLTRRSSLGTEKNSNWVQTHLFGSCGLNAATADSDIDLYV